MSLRDDLIERIAPEIHANDAAYAPPYWSDCTDDMKAWYRLQAEGALDAMLNLLTERATEWRYVSRIDGSGHRETIVPKLLAVLRATP